jgi:dienelactone hydrolase
MIQKIAARLVLMLAFCPASLLAADAPGAGPGSVGDPRAEMLHDVDHPWTFTPAFTNRDEWEKRAEQVRRQILVAEGLWPMPEKTPLNAVIHGKIEREGYTIEKVFFASMPGHYVSGNLYRPTGRTGKLPAVLFAHGHWEGGRFYENNEKAARQQIQIGAEKWMEGARFLLQAPCAMLARLGCVVFQYDMVGYADSTAITHRVGFTDTEAAMRLQSFMGLQTWNSVRSLDFLASLPDVDPARIAMTGASGGGTQTMILCGIDSRPAVSFPAVMVGTAMQGGCICENTYYLRLHTNNVEIASLFAPKPEGMTSANDWTKDLVNKGFPEIKSIYGLYGAQNNVMAWYRSFEHNYNQVSRELMYNWMNEHLKLGLASPIEEKPFVPVPPKELSVYDADHPQPADSVDALVLRKKMTAASNEQLAELATKPEEYRKMLAGALGVMIAPAPAISAAPVALIAGKSGGTDNGEIVLAEGGARIRYALMTPPKWDGSITVWVDLQGRSVLSSPKTQDAVRQLLDHNSAILAADLFMSGPAVASNPLARGGKYAGYTFSGYYYGYNAPVLACCVNDLLAAVANAGVVKPGESPRVVRLLATGKAGAWALLGKALANESISRAAIDLDRFDFDQVRDATDEMMLPGALKYGGIAAFASLCTWGKTAVWNTPQTWQAAMRVPTPAVLAQQGESQLSKMVDWLVTP